MLIMADDGRGGSIKIPSFLISYKDGQYMIDEIHAEHKEHEERMKDKDSRVDEPIPPPPAIDFDNDEKTAEELNKWEENWKRHKRRGNFKRVIITADIDLASKTDGMVAVDMWYANSYELFNSGWDLNKYSQIGFHMTDKAQIVPRLITNRCLKCSPEEKKSKCI